MNGLAVMTAFAIQFFAYHNGVCQNACTNLGKDRGKFVLETTHKGKKTAYCDCTERYLYNDIAAKPLLLKMSPEHKSDNKTDYYKPGEPVNYDED